MATTRTNPMPTTNEDDLSHEQWWSLFDELRRSQQAAYAEHGGPVALRTSGTRRERRLMLFYLDTKDWIYALPPRTPQSRVPHLRDSFTVAKVGSTLP